MNSLRKKKINAFLTSFIIFISVVAIGLVIAPRLIGYSAYSIESGSMEPTIKEGSLVFVKKNFEFDSYKVDDIVTFSDTVENKSFTHRIIEIDSEKRTFDTKGDANNDKDPLPTDFTYAIGKVDFAIPYLGFAASFFRNRVVEIAVIIIYLAWMAIEIELFLTERKKRDE